MSLKKIAEMVGVSPSTVSRVLNNTSHNCASKELKDKIWAAAKELSYVPNTDARNLKNGNRVSPPRHPISIILGRFGTLETDPFFSELFRYMEEEIFAHDCIIDKVLTASEVMTQTTFSSDGYIILGRCPENVLGRLKKSTRNIVGVGRNPTNFYIDEIICDGKTAAITAMEYLISLGHKRIGYIGDCSYETRYIGYCETMLKHNLPMDYSNIHETDQTTPAGYQTFQKIKDSTTASAIFCANDATALGVLNAMAEQKIRKNNRISIISIDNTRLSETAKPLLTTVNIPAEDMGRMAVKVLLDRIRRRHMECMRVEFPCRLIERESCYPV